MYPLLTNKHSAVQASGRILGSHCLSPEQTGCRELHIVYTCASFWYGMHGRFGPAEVCGSVGTCSIWQDRKLPSQLTYSPTHNQATLPTIIPRCEGVFIAGDPGRPETRPSAYDARRLRLAPSPSTLASLAKTRLVGSCQQD